jgi:hypothetical protein
VVKVLERLKMISVNGYHIYRDQTLVNNLVTIERSIAHADGSVDVDKKILKDFEVVRLFEGVLNE